MTNIRLGEWGIRLAAITLAVFIWFHAVTENTYHRELDIPIQVGEVSSTSGDEHLVVANEVPDHSRVLVAGRGKDLLQLDDNAFVLKVQPTGHSGGAAIHRLSVSDIENRTANSRIQVQEIVHPKEVNIEFDVHVEREVPVEPDVQIQIAEGHTLVGTATVEPTSVTASGPRRQIADLQVVKTHPVLLDNAKQDIQQLLAIEQPSGTRITIEPNHVTFRADVQILAEDVIEGVPVRIRNLDTTAVIAVPSRVKVKVRGGIDIIAALDPEKDLDLSVDYGSYAGSELEIEAASNAVFEIREIFPPAVQLVER
jgi:hypothetical protein